MANVNSPFGLYPLRHRSGGVVRANGYPIASGQAGAIYSGDPVKRLDTGKIAVDFEYEDPSRWAITPTNVRQMAEQLRPQGS